MSGFPAQPKLSKLSLAAAGSVTDSGQAAATEVSLGNVGPIPGSSLVAGSLLDGWFSGNMDVPSGAPGTATFRIRALTTSGQAIATGTQLLSFSALNIVTTGAGATFEQRVRWEAEVRSVSGTLTLFPGGLMKNLWGTNAGNQDRVAGVASAGVAGIFAADIYVAFSVTFSQNTVGCVSRLLSGGLIVAL